MDFEPASREKGRFMMLSAPFKDMYTGDYHFPTAGNRPDWGLVYMNFFQSANPDYPGSVAREKTYTAAFGSMGTPLPLGKAFNINVLPDTEGRHFSFPHSFASYTGKNGQSTGILSRKHTGRFITDSVISKNGELDLPVDDTYSLIQIVNPFAAYLKVDEFLSHPANRDKIESSAYKLWNGDVNDCFISLLVAGDTMRYVIADDFISEGKWTLIAPFQSFFVMKKPNAAPFKTLKMFSFMTTTVGPSPEYILRSKPEEEGILRITAKQQSRRNATLLRREKGAVPSYNPDEDSRKAFIDSAPVSIYTLTDDNEALAINRNNRFDAPVKFGMRLKNTKVPVTLEFPGIETFGQAVYLVDHELDDKVIDLQKQPSYTFGIRSDAGSSRVTELNDRFSLRFGELSSAEQIDDDGINVYAGRGSIFIKSTNGRAITGVMIHDISGATVYRWDGAGSSIVIPVASSRLYFVKIDAEDKSYPIRKILVYQ
jgi:hypothetical protein